jgi:hypothetical protein
MASQLPTEDPNTVESRAAIAGVTFPRPLNSRLNVEEATPKLAAHCLALILWI